MERPEPLIMVAALGRLRTEVLELRETAGAEETVAERLRETLTGRLELGTRTLRALGMGRVRTKVLSDRRPLCTLGVRPRRFTGFTPALVLATRVR